MTCLICSKTFGDGRKARIHYRFHRPVVQQWQANNQRPYNDEDAMRKYLVPEQKASRILGTEADIQGLQQMEMAQKQQQQQQQQQQPSPPISPLATAAVTTPTVAATVATPSMQNDVQHPSPQEQAQAQSPQQEHQALGWRGWEGPFSYQQQPTQSDLPGPGLNNMNPTSPVAAEQTAQSPWSGQPVMEDNNSWGAFMEEGQLGFLGHIPQFSDPPPPPALPSTAHQYPVATSPGGGFMGDNGYFANTNLIMEQQQQQGQLPTPETATFLSTNQLGTFSPTQQSATFPASQEPSTFLSPTQPGGFSVPQQQQQQQPVAFTAPPQDPVPAQSALPFTIQQQLPNTPFSFQQQVSPSFPAQAQMSSPYLVQEQAAASFPYFFTEQLSLPQFTLDIPTTGFVADVVVQEQQQQQQQQQQQHQQHQQHQHQHQHQQQQPMHINTNLPMPLDWTSISPPRTAEDPCPPLVPLDSWPLDKDTMARIRARCRALESDMGETEASKERALRHGWKTFNSRGMCTPSCDDLDGLI